MRAFRWVSLAGAVLAWSAALAAARAYQPGGEPLHLSPDQPPARVARVESAHVIRGGRIHAAVLGEMLEDGLRLATGASSAREAWNSLLQRDDVIGVKFDPVGAAELGTSDAVASALVRSLVQAGWEADRIVLIDAPPSVARRLGTHPALSGFDEHPVVFRGGRARVRSALHQVTAIISVSTLKTDNLCFIRCCLNNVGLGWLRASERFRRSACSPYAADVAGLAVIRDKVRLCIVDALRVVYEDGPIPFSDNINEAGIMLVSTDPVAADSVGMDIINQIRDANGLSVRVRTGADVPLIAEGHRQGLGIAVSRGIDILRGRH